MMNVLMQHLSGEWGQCEHDDTATGRAPLEMCPLLLQQEHWHHIPCSLRQEKRVPKAADVLQGTLDLLLLKALSLAPMHGWGITNRIQQLSRGSFQIGQGSLYPALHRYEKRGWVTSHWRTTEHNRIARYYDLTAVGRRALAEEVARWRSYAGAMALVVEAR